MFQSYRLLLVTAIGAMTGFFLPSAFAEIQKETICPKIVFEHDSRDSFTGFTDTEKRLICGDTEIQDAVGDSWKDIPFSQSKFHLNTFLQDRGYYQAHYSQESKADGIRIVDAGTLSRVRRLESENAPPHFDLNRKRNVLGQPLTPLLLDQLEQWVFERVQALGYACPVVSSGANPETGVIVIKLQLGSQQKVVRILDQSLGGIAPGFLNRYNAFELGREFNGDLLTITERRITNEGVLQGVHFKPSCQEDGVALLRSGIEGPPRLLSVGFGLNTEGFLIVKSTWKNSRLGKRASLYEITGIASAKDQELRASINWYYLPYSSRRYLRPAVALRHLNETPYEYSNLQNQILSGTSYDSQKIGMTFRVGPNLDLIRKIRGNGLKDSHFLALETQVGLMSHGYELALKNPRTGYTASLLMDLNDRSILSDATAQKLYLSWEGLWNFRDYDPPLWVLGFRGGAATTVTGERPGPGTVLPPSFFQYLGGSQSIRGFGRFELPGDQNGSLTSFFGGVEFRLVESPLPLKIQPIGFVDFGWLGNEPFQVAGPLYWSPGVGLRWDSPVGSFRGTLAHGYIAGGGKPPQADELSHLQFYLSFGEEF